MSNWWLNISLIVNLICIILLSIKYSTLPIFDFKRNKGIIFNKGGDYIGIKEINNKKEYFNFGEQTYNFNPLSSYFVLEFAFWRTKYYFYELGNPEPISIKTERIPILQAQCYNDILEADWIKKLNAGARGDIWSKLLTLKNLVILGVIIAIIWYFSKGKEVGV